MRPPPANLDPPPAYTAPAQTETQVKPLTEGPLHEAFLSKAKDREPFHVPKGPPTPLVERPAVDPPSEKAQWIEGYWDWDPGRNDYVWVTGTWRVPPPGRLWVNGYWKRDDQGWYHVPGFWSDRQTDRIDYRKNGPPADRPAEDIGESPGADHFYVPGRLGPRRRRRGLAQGLLGQGPAGLVVGAGPVGPAARAAGSSRRVTGTAPWRTAARSSRPPR